VIGRGWGGAAGAGPVGEEGLHGAGVLDGGEDAQLWRRAPGGLLRVPRAGDRCGGGLLGGSCGCLGRPASECGRLCRDDGGRDGAITRGARSC